MHSIGVATLDIGHFLTDELEALLPADALDRRPLAQPGWPPFTLE